MPEARANESTKITMDVGTVYDFFQSLAVLQSPKKFAVRGAWASGMLARLTPESRETLSRAKHVLSYPMHYLPSLPQPKNVETLLWSLAQQEPVARLQRLACTWLVGTCGWTEVFAEVADRGRWSETDLTQLQKAADRLEKAGKPLPDERLTEILDVWADAKAFSEAYLSALRNYYDVFFREEEKRIVPTLEAAGARVADLAEKISLPDLIEEISAGIRYESLPDMKELILAPSYWITPLMLTVQLDAQRTLLMFGARGADDSIVPGETVPDGLIRSLKALSDPTRLRILRLVADRSMGAAELAKSLRLRTPTVIHHLGALRLSGLIQIRMPEAKAKQKACFSLRTQAIHDVMSTLEDFLSRSDKDEESSTKS